MPVHQPDRKVAAAVLPEDVAVAIPVEVRRRDDRPGDRDVAEALRRRDLAAGEKPDRGVAARVAPQKIGVAVAVEVALPDDRPRERDRVHSVCLEQLRPSISQVAVFPEPSRQAMSLRPSVLKS